MCSRWISSHTLWDMSADLTLGRWWRGLSTSFLLSLSLMRSLLPKTTSSRHLWKQKKEQRGAEEFSYSVTLNVRHCRNMPARFSCFPFDVLLVQSFNKYTKSSTLSVQYISDYEPCLTYLSIKQLETLRT